MAVTEKAVEAQKEKADYEAIARSILRVGQSAKRMYSAGLNRRAICLLIRDMTSVGMTDIERVLDAVETMPQRYLSREFLKKHADNKEATDK